MSKQKSELAALFEQYIEIEQIVARLNRERSELLARLDRVNNEIASVQAKLDAYLGDIKNKLK